MKRSPPAAWLALARLVVDRNLTRPSAERQWGEVNHLLTEAGKVLKDMGYSQVYNVGAFKDWAESGGAIDTGM